MPVESGTKLGPYEIETRLGAGGMGEVYRARDTRLGRIVAIKVLAGLNPTDELIRRRFAREARAISSLNHPNICALYDIGSDHGHEFLVMELLEGETLAERLTRGALPQEEAIRFAVEITGALERAHRQGIIHRDLKPGNIMLTKSGAKLLDFGLARMSEAAAGSAAAPLTADDAMIGTVEYMAPEQLNGAVLDARADIFAFGAVLYEMLTGARPFGGHNRASVIGAILFSPAAPMIERNGEIPAALDRVVSACLEKDPDNRIQTAHDLRLQLQWIAEGAPEEGEPKKRRVRSRRHVLISWIAAAFVAGALGAGAVVWRMAPTAGREVRFNMQAPVSGEQIDWPVISPDGTRLVFVSETRTGERSLWLRDLGSTSPHMLPATSGATQPFWSPDSNSIAFFSTDKLQVMGLNETHPQPLVTAGAPRGGAWSSNGSILFSPHVSSAIWATDRTGSSARQVTRLDAALRDVTHRWPEFLPDGEHFLFVIQSRNLQRSGLYLGSLREPSIRKISTVQSRAIITPDGWMFFVQDRKLWRQPFDIGKEALRGVPVAVAGDMATDLKITGATRISASHDHSLAFASPLDTRTAIAWRSRDGRLLQNLAPAGYYFNPALSPDGRTLAVSRIDESTGRNSIWLMDTSRGTMSEFVDDDANADAPVWTADGKRILYTSDRRGTFEIYERQVGSVAADRLVMPSKSYAQPVASGQTGTLFHVASAKGGGDYIFWKNGARVPRVFHSDIGGGAADMSRDGRWFAALAIRDESTRYGVEVRSVDNDQQRIQVGPEGSQPTWRPDGRELYYVTPDAQLYATAFNDGQIGASIALFRVGSIQNFYANRSFVPSADGTRFLVLDPPPAKQNASATVVLHWDGR